MLFLLEFTQLSTMGEKHKLYQVSFLYIRALQSRMRSCALPGDCISPACAFCHSYRLLTSCVACDFSKIVLKIPVSLMFSQIKFKIIIINYLQIISLLINNKYVICLKTTHGLCIPIIFVITEI